MREVEGERVRGGSDGVRGREKEIHTYIYRGREREKERKKGAHKRDI